MTLRFAPFEVTMADALVPMWREAFEYGVGIVDPNPIEDQRAYLFAHVLPEHAISVALEGQRIVGFLASNALSVSQIHVRVGCHGRGIGSELLRRAKEVSGGTL